MNRKTLNHLLKVGLLCSLVAAPVALAAGDATASGASTDAIHYNAPSSQGQVRVNGIAQRDGAHQKLPNLFVLTPDHVGLTVQEQPTIFFYLSDTTDTKLVVTITRDGEADPVLETQLPATKGIGRLSLAEKKVKLEPDVQYQITFALKPDAKKHSEDLCASGMIKRVKPPEALVARLVARADPTDRAIAYAKQGIWYDALAVLSDEIDDKDVPSEKAVSMRHQRAALMEQVSLQDVANFDLGTEER